MNSPVLSWSHRVVGDSIEPRQQARSPSQKLRIYEENRAFRKKVPNSPRGSVHQLDADASMEPSEVAAPTPIPWNARHLEKLKEGVAAWNAWREQHPNERPDLSGVDFTESGDLVGTLIWSTEEEGTRKHAVLKEINLSNASLMGANLSNADLTEADLSDAYLDGANFSEATLHLANLTATYLGETDFAGANLTFAIFRRAFFYRTVLTEANLQSAELTESDLGFENLSNLNLEQASLRQTNCFGTNFQGSILAQADLTGADVRNANLSEASLRHATLRNVTMLGAALSGTDFSYADVQGVDLSGRDLRKLQFTGADLKESDLSGSDLSVSSLSLADLSRAKLVNTDVSGADLSYTVFEFTIVRGIRFDRSKLRCRGAGAIEHMLGDLRFQSAVRESAFIAAQWADIVADFPYTLRPRGTTPGGSAVSVRNLQTSAGLWRRSASLPIDLLRAFLPNRTSALLPIIFAAVLTLIGATVIDPHAIPTASILGAIRELGVLHTLGLAVAGLPLGYWSAFGALTALLFSSWYARWPLTAMWSLLDYGRSWVRVMLLAALLIGMFGTIYAQMHGTWIDFVVSSDVRQPQVEGGLGLHPDHHWFYPWFVAAMGFCTLGISDMVAPIDGAGQLIILLNVIAGFVTLGLLLAVLTDQFSSRH